MPVVLLLRLLLLLADTFLLGEIRAGATLASESPLLLLLVALSLRFCCFSVSLSFLVLRIFGTSAPQTPPSLRFFAPFSFRFFWGSSFLWRCLSSASSVRASLSACFEPISGLLSFLSFLRTVDAPPDVRLLFRGWWFLLGELSGHNDADTEETAPFVVPDKEFRREDGIGSVWR
jgi:hypothetical protein